MVLAFGPGTEGGGAVEVFAVGSWGVWLLVCAEWASSLAWLSPLLFSAVAALAGLFNAVLLGRLAHRMRAREAHPAV